ncbi:MAG: sigma-54 dependent transcriptional regulator [Dokdonella sp.]
MSKQIALVVDDERDIRALLSLTLGRMGLQVETAATVAEARQKLAEQSYALCFTDMRLPDGSGQEVIELVAREYSDTPIAMITAYGNVDAAVGALKAGAFDFVSKPVDINVLRRLVQTALRLAETKRADQGTSSSKLVGDSPPMQELRATIAKIARSQAPVYIAGESGVGKELVARLIHELGPRATTAFVPVNCGAIPSELMESEFFGHSKGSFTGAVGDKAGLFQAAQGGTLFLDEVAELPIHMQVKLLRVIQEKAVRPIGANAEVPVDVRILSATHKNLAKLVDAGTFRQDLFYRINVIELRVPPLRARRSDIPMLATRVLERLAKENSSPPAQLTASALESLNTYEFPGNVRELENILERAVAMCENNSIETDDLRLPQHAPVSAAPAQTPQMQSDHQSNRQSSLQSVARNGSGQPDGEFTTAFQTPPPSSNGASASSESDSDFGDLASAVAETERAAIMKALEATRWNRTAAARQLGLTLRQLRYRLEKLGIE